MKTQKIKKPPKIKTILKKDDPKNKDGLKNVYEYDNLLMGEVTNPMVFTYTYRHSMMSL